MPENSTHKCTKAVNNVQPIRNSLHTAKILSVCNRLQDGDYEKGNGGKRKVSRLTQFIHTMLQFLGKKNVTKLSSEFSNKGSSLTIQCRLWVNIKLRPAPFYRHTATATSLNCSSTVIKLYRCCPKLNVTVINVHHEDGEVSTQGISQVVMFI